MHPETRAAIDTGGVAIWLKADLDVLMSRVRRRSNRPLLKAGDPVETMRRLMDERYPVYAEAPIHIASREVAHETVLAEIVAALVDHLSRMGAPRTPDCHMSLAAPSASDSAPATIRVDLGERSYDILIGSRLLARAGQEIASRLPKCRAAIVTDDTVAGLHLAALRESLTRAGIDHMAVSVPPGESSKSFATLQTVTDAILGARLERGDVVVALGGGVVGDLAGFASGIVRRGMRLVQVPTTLLAQVDSSVGGKTGINTHHGKNLVGVFHQPRLVMADTATLDSLPARHFRAGYAEVAKIGLIGDASFFSWLEANWKSVFTGGGDRNRAIAIAVGAKAKLVMADERETGDRALLNLGHTFGHALEAAAGYSDRLVHGEAVALGIVLAFQFSARRGLCAADDPRRVAAHFAKVGLPTKLSEVPGGLPGPQPLLDLILQDKKVTRGQLTFILARGVGQAFIERDVSPDSVLGFLEATSRPGSGTT